MSKALSWFGLGAVIGMIPARALYGSYPHVDMFSSNHLKVIIIVGVVFSIYGVLDVLFSKSKFEETDETDN